RQLGENGTVAEFHEGVNDGFGMNDHTDPFRRQIEQPTSFDDFQRLVHERGGIDGDFGAHTPGGMIQGFVHSDSGQVRGFPTANRSSAGSQYDAFDLIGSSGLHRLENGAVFTIDRQQTSAALFGQIHHQRTGHDERFLVGDRHGFADFQSRPGSRQAGSAD